MQLQEIWRSVAGHFARVGGIAAMDRYAGLSYIESVGVFYSREELARARAEWKGAGKTVVFTNGCYDLLHPGTSGCWKRRGRWATF